MSVVWGTARPSRSLCECRHGAFAVVRILRIGRRNMPSARTPDPSSAAPNAAPGTPPSTAPWPAAPAATAAAPAVTAAPAAAALAGLAAREPVAEAVSPVAFGGLRLIEVPGDWPPYDCEVHGTACPAAHEVTVTGPCADPDLGTAVPEGTPGDAQPPGSSPEFSADRAVGGADPAIAWSRQFAQVIAEILAGARSPRQLAPLTTEHVRTRIGQLSQSLMPGQKPRIRRIVTSRPTAHVVEMTVVLSFGPRSRALALRLEHVPPRLPRPGFPAARRDGSAPKSRLANPPHRPFRAWMPRSCRSPSAVPLRSR